MNETIQDPVSYDIYDQGYKTGSQAYIFLGPIWIEEAVYFQIENQISKSPIYGYNDVKLTRFMQGRFITQGSLGINYVESNYLLKIIKEVLRRSSTEENIEQLIKARASIFKTRLRQRAADLYQNEGVLSDYAKSLTDIDRYADRICKEAELASYTDNILDPASFELTIIYGDLYSSEQSIEIYEGVQITGSGKRSANDDEINVEVYHWGSRGLKELQKDKVVSSEKYTFSKTNLMVMAQEVISKLADNLMESPDIAVSSSSKRTSLMMDTNKLGIGGVLHPSSRFYGNNASFIEMIYSLEYPQKYSDIQSDTSLDIVNSAGVRNPSDPPIYLSCPDNESSISFDNNFGKLVAIDREHTLPHLKAIAPVEPIDLYDYAGGSIVMPIYKRNSFNIGSFIPPKIVDADTFSYTNNELNVLTYCTLWSCLTGCRTSAGINKEADNNDDNYISELGQPLYSITYIDKIEPVDGDEYGLDISVPVFVDYLNIDQADNDSLHKKTKSPIVKPNHNEVIKFRYNSNDEKLETTTTLSEKVTGTTDKDKSRLRDLEIFKESIISVIHTECNPVVIEYSEEPEVQEFNPTFFEQSLLNNSAKLAGTFNKCIYTVPLIFEDKEYVTGEEIEGSMVYTINYEDIPYPSPSNPNEVLKNLIYFLKDRNNKDDICKYDFVYDWAVTDRSGIQNVDKELKISGVYFIDPKEGKTHVNDLSGNPIPVDTILDYPGPKVHVFWLMALLPTYKPDTEDISIVHDITQRSGRYAEFYNITRCDVIYQNKSLYTEYDPGDSILEKIRKSFWDILQSIKHAFKDVVGDTSFTKYIVKNMNRVVGFLDGYAVSINVNSILSQLLKCTFSDSSIGNYIQDENVTFETAFKIATGTQTQNDLETSVITELGSIVRNTIKDKLKERNITIIDEDDYGNIIIDRNVIIPPPDLVSYGLTDIGSEDLLDIRNRNISFIKSRNTTSTTSVSDLSLGDYNAE